VRSKGQLSTAQGFELEARRTHVAALYKINLLLPSLGLAGLHEEVDGSVLEFDRALGFIDAVERGDGAELDYRYRGDMSTVSTCIGGWSANDAERESRATALRFF